MRRVSNQSDLTASDIIDIREMVAETNEDGSRAFTDTAIAAQYGVERKTIYNIRNRNTWRHVPEPTVLEGFEGYRIYPDGRIFSEGRQNFIKADTRGRRTTVRMTARNGTRRTMPLDNVIRSAFGTTALAS